MKPSKVRETAAPTPSRSRHRPLRSRPTPKWLLDKTELNAIAQRRCLTVLAVLSGEKAVTEAITELAISRGTYYQWEERALEAMLASLAPGSEAPGSSGPSARVAELETRVATLEREKRRSERLLLLTRKVVKSGPVTTGAGRPPKARRASTKPGSRSLRASTSKPSRVTAKAEGAAGPSIPTSDGGSGR